MLKKILIANRGEIACRIIRTAREMGIATVAVYSEPDGPSFHVELADEAYCIGPAAATLSYLNQQEIVRVAKAAGAEAVHPGYGFLSENPEFAAACLAAGLIFIGPSPEVITSMGIKSRARDIMEQAGIAVVPGCYLDAVPDRELETKAESIGYPLLIKADRGGGGKGIRLVPSAAELAEAIAAARREAAGAFGDATLLMEKQVVNGRHVEVQIFRDSHGHAVHLFERDCSLQRRHQKIIEESPAPNLSERIRQTLHRTAVAAAETIGYVGAGTVEFLVAPDGEFYFLEINTRLQVEHPVTEMVTGQDLVAWQLLVAAGEMLPLRQEELACQGHAIEARIYAEDPGRDFLPSTGILRYLRQPMAVEGVRVDSGVRQGDRVTPWYDPMLAKLIVRGRDREEALSRLITALAGYHVAGITTNSDFLRRLLVDPAFVAATHTTRYVDGHLHALTQLEAVTAEVLAIAAIYRVLENQRLRCQQAGSGTDPYSPWNSGRGFRVNQADRIDIGFSSQGEEVKVAVYPAYDGYSLEIAETVITVTGVELEGAELRCRIDGRNIGATLVSDDDQLTLFCGGGTYRLLQPDPGRTGHESGVGNSLRAPIPGKVTELFVAAGASVRQGEPLLVLEAMKMEYVIRAPADGTVVTLFFRQGDSVREKERLVEFQQLEEGVDAAA